MLLDVVEYIRQAKQCVRCSFCKYIDMNWIKGVRFSRQCPIDTRYALNLYSPHGLLFAAQGEAEDAINFTPKLVDAMYHCTLCGACDSRCKRNLDCEVLQVIENLRIRYVEQGNPLLPGHSELLTKVDKTKNIYGEPQKNRRNWIENIKPENKAETIFFVGDNAAYKQPELARAVAAILNKAGVAFSLLEDEWSAGNEVLAIGDVKLARKLAEHNMDAIKKAGAKTVVTGSAECYKALKVDIPKLLGKSTEEMPYVAVHISEFVDSAIKEKKLTMKKTPMKVTYHDSCNLGRLSESWQQWTPKYDGAIPIGKTWRRGDRGIYDAPRNVLSAIPGVELMEMERTRSNAWSVGSTGAVSAAFHDFALWSASERLEEAVATGAEIVVTCSPDENQILREANESKKTGMNILDFVEVIVRAL